jgi:hypothetical protein
VGFSISKKLQEKPLNNQGGRRNMAKKYNPENFDLQLFFEKVAKREAKKKQHKKNRRILKWQNQ